MLARAVVHCIALVGQKSGKKESQCSALFRGFKLHNLTSQCLCLCLMSIAMQLLILGSSSGVVVIANANCHAIPIWSMVQWWRWKVLRRVWLTDWSAYWNAGAAVDGLKFSATLCIFCSICKIVHCKCIASAILKAVANGSKECAYDADTNRPTST